MVLKIGPLAVDPPVVLAPMAGVTNAAFRKLCRSYGAGLYVSEMMSARGLVETEGRMKRMLTFGADEQVRSVQLYGVDPRAVGEAARRLVEDHGVDHIDLNFGCPAAKVTRKGGGAALPVRPALFAAIVRAAVRGAAPVPVTVKLRIGIDAARPTSLRAGLIAEAEGAVAVALHARTAEQHYAGNADWLAIAALKAAVTTVPVLGNGDIWEARDALRMTEETGCDGVVIGRGCLGRPWLFRDLVDAYAGRPVQDPPRLGAVIDTMREHLGLLIELFGEEVGVRDFRKHIGWYLAGYPVGGVRRRRLTFATTATDLLTGLAELDPAIALPAAAIRLPRGHTNGPRRVHLPDGWCDAPDDPTPPVGADLLVSGG
ncbi:MAG: tRNA dihydrouridine synthase DusB [Acidimicrobiia bacterium]